MQKDPSHPLYNRDGSQIRSEHVQFCRGGMAAADWIALSGRRRLQGDGSHSEGQCQPSPKSGTVITSIVTVLLLISGPHRNTNPSPLRHNTLPPRPTIPFPASIREMRSSRKAFWWINLRSRAANNWSETSVVVHM